MLASSFKRPGCGGICCGRPESGGYEARKRAAPDRPSPRAPKVRLGYGRSAGFDWLRSLYSERGEGAVLPANFAIKVIC